MFTLLMMTIGCASDNTLQKSGYADGVGEGSIHGRVCNAETGTWLGSATVYTHVVSTSGELIDTPSTVSDAEGWWTLEALPSGTYKIYIQYGSTMVDLFDVDLGTDEDLVLPEESCAGSVETEVAAVTADYDDWSEVLPAIGLGNFTLIEGDTGDEILQFLLNPSEMASYDAIFFAGGIVESGVLYPSSSDDRATVDAVHENLKSYVQDGGVLYASDWAYDVVEQVWPDAVEFYGEDTDADAAQLGTPTTADANVKEKGLEKALGAEKAKVVMDLDAWPVMTGVGSDTTLYLTGEAPWRSGEETGTETGAPLLAGFESGKGKVYVSSWRVEANVDGDGKAILQYLMKDL